MILCIGTTPAAQRVMFFRELRPDSVNRATRVVEGAAGKAVNVAKVLKTLGEEPLATGFLGGPRGDAIRQILSDKGIACDFVAVQAPTRECVTVIDESAGTITELVQESAPVDRADYHNLRTIIERRLSGCRAVVMSGTLAPGGRPDFYADCVALARKCALLTVVDAQGAALLEALTARPGLIKPNRTELGATVGTELIHESEVIKAMRQVQERGAERVVVTAGAHAALALEAERLWRIHPPAIKPVNPIGSGDSFTAGLVWRLLKGDDLGEAARWGAASGAANALSPMAGELEPTDVNRLASQTQVERLA